ncbi:MAG: hypothetical protein JO142_02195 [Burkholderiales bacterium]|nr:hypothetical protein [Burkholderiales bacterium]
MTWPGFPIPAGRFVSAIGQDGNVQTLNLVDYLNQNPNASIYIPTADFYAQVNGATLFFQLNQPFVMTPDLQAALTAQNAPIQFAWGQPLTLNSAANSSQVALLFGHML